MSNSKEKELYLLETKQIIKVNLLIKLYGRIDCLNAVRNKTQQIYTAESLATKLI